jgi:hypothetical protein
MRAISDAKLRPCGVSIHLGVLWSALAENCNRPRLDPTAQANAFAMESPNTSNILQLAKRDPTPICRWLLRHTFFGMGRIIWIVSWEAGRDASGNSFSSR